MTNPTAILPPTSEIGMPCEAASVDKASKTPHHNPEGPSIIGRLWPIKACSKQAIPPKIKENCMVLTISA